MFSTHWRILLLISIIIFCGSIFPSTSAGKLKQDSFLFQQLKASFEVYQMMRNDIGVYLDSLSFEYNPYPQPCSIASVGMALVSLCIADALNLTQNASAQVTQTLQAMNGYVSGFSPARSPQNGFFRHWINMTSGERMWNSEFSTIDTSLLVSGGLFAKNYFSNNSEIAQLADELYLSINWDAAIANPDTGEIYMVFNEDGTGDEPLKPFNEYMIVAWMCKNAPVNNQRALQAWNKFFQNTTNLPKVTWANYTLLTDNMWPVNNVTNILSNFCIQFAFYLCQPFSNNIQYLKYLANAYMADVYWFHNNSNFSSYVFGTGAGPQPDGYDANNFRENFKYGVASPHILAGFIPLNSSLINNLQLMFNNGTGVYNLPNSTTQVLWRVLAVDPTWRAPNAAGVDWSTMVFGLASHPDALGFNFFKKNNNFTFPNASAFSNYVNSKLQSTQRVTEQ